MLAIIYTATVWPCVINILNSNYISSTRHSVLLEQHAFALKMLISEVGGVRRGRGCNSLTVTKVHSRDENKSFMLQLWDDADLKYLWDQK